MKLIAILPAFVLIFVSLVSCEKAAAPEAIYKEYLASIQAMSSMSEDDYQRFLSLRAQSVVRDKLEAVGDDQVARFLTLFKAEAVLPENSNVSLESGSDDSMILKIVAEDYPEKGSTHEQNVIFIKESGWKIDKIEVITSGEDFKYKSTTY